MIPALHRIEPTAPVFQLFNGGLIAEDRYTDVVMELGAPRRRLGKGRFYAELRAGATLVVNGFEHYSLAALRLCAEVRRFSGAPTAGNAYFSIGGRGTFGRHWDTHEVFALQLIGRKRWQVFAPSFPLPLGMHRSERRGALPRHTGSRLRPRDGRRSVRAARLVAPSATARRPEPALLDRHLRTDRPRLPELGLRAPPARRARGADVSNAELDAAIEALRGVVLSTAGPRGVRA